MAEPSDIVERLLSNAVSWLRDDAFEGRDREEESRINGEAAAEITRLRAALADITYEHKGKILVAYLEDVNLADKWPFLRDLHGSKP